METGVKEQQVGKNSPSQGGLGQAQHGHDANVPLSTVTSYIRNVAKRAVSNTEKKWLYDFVEGLGPAIVNHIPSGPGAVTTQEFLLACGIDPHWGNIEN